MGTVPLLVGHGVRREMCDSWDSLRPLEECGHHLIVIGRHNLFLDYMCSGETSGTVLMPRKCSCHYSIVPVLPESGYSPAILV